MPLLYATLLATGAAGSAVVVERVLVPRNAMTSCRDGAAAMSRLDLLFGLGKQDGSVVSEEEWQSFLAAEVTPRFPDGLTVLTAFGQWKAAAGVIAKESSRVLVIWYQSTATTEASIETIRQAYKVRFGQASVMRVDGRSCVSF